MSANETTRIETDRLVLRAPRLDDAAAIYRGINDFDIVRMLGNAPWPYQPAHADEYVALCATRDPASHRPLAIEHREHGLIGMTGFYPAKDGLFTEIGYWLARPHWGRGYATEAINAALVWAHRDWGKRAIAANHFQENDASGRVLVKAGMLYTGVVRPVHCLARGEVVPSREMIWLA